MLRPGKIAGIILLAIIAISTGCAERIKVFTRSDLSKSKFYSDVDEMEKFYIERWVSFEDSIKDKLKSQVKSIDSVEIYVARFEEIEAINDNVIEHTYINTELKNKGKFSYAGTIGEYQEAYLIFMKIRPEQDAVQNRSVVFFSAKFNANGKCIGYGPSYYGRTSVVGKDTVIDFRAKLKVKDKKKNWWREVERTYPKSRGRTGCIEKTFYIQKKETMVNINRVVVTKTEMGGNKVGGGKPVVFPVKEILGDEAALRFNRVEIKPDSIKFE